MKGKSSKPNSGTTVARDVVEADNISCVPPRSADCCCSSLPSCDAGNSRILSLPPLLAERVSANFLTPKLTGWSALLRCPQRIVRSWISCADAAAPPKNIAPSTAADRPGNSLIDSSLKQTRPERPPFCRQLLCRQLAWGQNHITKCLSNDIIRNI